MESLRKAPVKRPAAKLPLKSAQELAVYDEWGRAIVAESSSITYSGLRLRLEQQHQVTAGNGTMQRWLRSLRQPWKVQSASRAVSIEEVETYREWALGVVSEDSSITYRRLRDRLQSTHQVTAPNGTMERWLRSLGQPRQIQPAARAVSIEELKTYREWALGVLSEDSTITYRRLRDRLESTHHVTAPNGTMQRWLRSLRDVADAPKAVSRQRTAAASMVRVGVVELAAYREWGLNCLRQNNTLTMSAMQQLLAQTHGVQAPKKAMTIWFENLSVPSKRQVGCEQWAEEDSKSFLSLYPRRVPMCAAAIDAMDPLIYYQHHGSWSFCDLCGRRKFGVASPPAQSSRQTYVAPPVSRCKQCPLSVVQLQSPWQGQTETHRLYVAPQESDWPR